MIAATQASTATTAIVAAAPPEHPITPCFPSQEPRAANTAIGATILWFLLQVGEAKLVRLVQHAGYECIHQPTPSQAAAAAATPAANAIAPATSSTALL